MAQWFHADSSNWYLYANSPFPVSYRAYYSLGTAEWKYCPATREIIHMTCPAPKAHRVDWLSASATTSGSIKEMDSFLNELRVYTTDVSIPTTVFLQAWSLYDKRWWSAEEGVYLEWINSLAEEHHIPVTDIMSIPVVPVKERA